MKIILGLLVFLGLLPGLHAAPATNAPSRVFLWQVQGEKGAVYLLGSIHMARADLYPLDDRIYQAFDKSDILAVEVDISNEHAGWLGMQVMAQAVYPASDALDKHLTPAGLKIARELGAKLELPPALLARMKPWFLAMTALSVELWKAGITPMHGVERHFLSRACKQQKSVVELEGAQAQLELFDGLSDAEQELFLQLTVADLPRMEKMADEVIALWKTGDAAALDKILKASLAETPAAAPLYKKLFEDRNVAMADKVEKYLESGRLHFIIVGAGHLTGERGIIALLSKKYRITQF